MKVIVRAVPGRAAMVDELIQQIPGLLVYCDESLSGARWNFHRVLGDHGESPCLHLEDDIKLTSSFLDKAQCVIDEHSNDVVQFFSRKKADITVGSRWEPGRMFSMNQCFYLPARMGTELLAYYPRWAAREDHISANDIFIADFLKGVKRKYWLHVPSLVQHRQVTSAIDPRRSRYRQSQTFEE